MTLDEGIAFTFRRRVRRRRRCPVDISLPLSWLISLTLVLSLLVPTVLAKSKSSRDDEPDDNGNHYGWSQPRNPHDPVTPSDFG